MWWGGGVRCGIDRRQLTHPPKGEQKKLHGREGAYDETVCAVYVGGEQTGYSGIGVCGDVLRQPPKWWS